MEVYLYDISLVRKSKVLELAIIEHCKALIKDGIINSTCFYFQENPFYQ